MHSNQSFFSAQIAVYYLYDSFYRLRYKSPHFFSPLGRSLNNRDFRKSYDSTGRHACLLCSKYWEGFMAPHHSRSTALCCFSPKGTELMWSCSEVTAPFTLRISLASSHLEDIIKYDIIKTKKITSEER